VYGTTTRAQVHSPYIFPTVSVCLQCTIDASARFKVFRIYFPTHCAQTCHSRRFTSSDKLNSLCLTINNNCLLYAYYLSVLHILVLGVSIVIHSILTGFRVSAFIRGHSWLFVLVLFVVWSGFIVT
jgi:hypothetical protein